MTMRERGSHAPGMLEEVARMRRVPGVFFSDGPAGRRATVAGTGLDVWEVIGAWKESEEQWSVLRENYDWLTDSQLQSALAYYKLYPEEIDARLAVEDHWTPERVKAELPFLGYRRAR
jgi:uncharacterized protein (DUF433 family)